MIRGGKIEAKETINAGEVGTETGKPPYLIAGVKINIHHLRNATVTILSLTRNFYKELKNVTIYYDEETDAIKILNL